MIAIAELMAFAQQHVDESPNIENYFIVASDSKLAKLYQDIVNDGDSCTMVVLIPSMDSDIPDEDNASLDNNLSFMIIKKTNEKEGHNEGIRIFGHTQIEIKKLLVKIISLHKNFNTNCVFNDIDLDSIKIDPVEDYLSANGWDLSFVNTTEL